MLLTAENYYSLEANKKYFSCSQYKDFVECESMAMAKIRGDYMLSPSKDFLLGSYVHAWNEGELEKFKEKNPDIISSRGTTKGQLKADFKFAETMIATLEEDQLAMQMLEGEKEVIMTGNFAGADWKIRIDSYRPGDAIVDLKTTRSIYELQWDEEKRARVSFIELYNYWIQVAIYSEIERQNADSDNYLNSYIVAISKEYPPDKEVIALDSLTRIDEELIKIEENMPRFIGIKNGFVKPTPCGRCAYCRSKKILDRVISYQEITAPKKPNDTDLRAV